MQLSSTPGLRALILWSLMLPACTSPVPTAMDFTVPSAAIPPEQVVEIQLKALQGNDEHDHGIAQVYLFASPSNLALTGPFPKFASMIHASYDHLLGHRRAVQLKPMTFEDQTSIFVEVTGKLGRVETYVWILQRQPSGPYAGCWLTSSVHVASAPDAVETIEL